jgi:helix-turn-helix protein
MATDDGCERSQEYITEQGLHERYLIPPRTAQRWRQDGTGPKFIRLGRRRILYRVTDVEEWLRARTYRHRADELAHAPAG